MSKTSLPEQSQAETSLLDSAKPEIITKYRTTADITNEVLQLVIERCTIGADVHELCQFSDNLIDEKMEKVYIKRKKNEKIRKGVAFPTCITVNEFVDYFSPFASESIKLQPGDLIKVHLGSHIDGYAALAAHSFVIGENEICGRKADVIRAAWAASEAAVRTIAVGVKSSAVTTVMKRCVESFKCNLVENVICNQVKQHVIHAVKSFPIQENTEEKTTPIEFEPYEVYVIDVVVSTGEGKARQSDVRTSVFHRNVEQNYSLKTPMARQFLREVTTRFPTLPFAARCILDEKVCCLGISECQRHELLEGYSVLMERPGEYVAQFQFTVMLLPGGTKRITGLPLSQDSILKSSYSITDTSLTALLSKSLNPKKKKLHNKLNANKETILEEA